MVDSVFKNYDHDQDGYISQEEFEKIAASFPFSFCVMDKDRWGFVYGIYGYKPLGTKSLWASLGEFILDVLLLWSLNDIWAKILGLTEQSSDECLSGFC